MTNEELRCNLTPELKVVRATTPFPSTTFFRESENIIFLDRRLVICNALYLVFNQIPVILSLIKLPVTNTIREIPGRAVFRKRVSNSSRGHGSY